MMSSFVYKQYILTDVVSVVTEQNYSTCKGNEVKTLSLFELSFLLVSCSHFKNSPVIINAYEYLGDKI